MDPTASDPTHFKIKTKTPAVYSDRLAGQPGEPRSLNSLELSTSEHTSRSTLGAKTPTKSSLFSLNRNSCDMTPTFKPNIKDFDLIGDICGVEDISFLYVAKHIPSGRMVSLKFTDMRISPDFEFIQEVERTVHNTIMCRHANILPYFITFEENERLWSVTGPIYGTCKSILNHLFKDGFNEVAATTILRETLKGVLYLHDNHMIHNDIKADNIVIDTHGETRLTGLRQLAHLAKNGGYMKSVFSLVGDNVEWAAPEVMAQVGIQ
jgi:Protein kinase domain